MDDSSMCYDFCLSLYTDDRTCLGEYRSIPTDKSWPRPHRLLLGYRWLR